MASQRWRCYGFIRSMLVGSLWLTLLAISGAQEEKKATSGPQTAPNIMERTLTACRLRQFPPPEQPQENTKTIYEEHFDLLPAGVRGDCALGPGYRGTGLILRMPDGRFDLSLQGHGPLPSGTIELWVKPRVAARIWHDQGWRYFLFGAPATPDGVRLDLSRHPATQLQLRLSDRQHEETLSLPTDKLDITAWHHLLLSWDLQGPRQHLWLLLDGQGRHVAFPAIFAVPHFRAFEFGNAPSSDRLPFLPLDGTIDELRVIASSVADRVAEEEKL